MMEKVKGKVNEFPNIIKDPSHNVQYRRNAFLGKGAFGKCFELTDTSNGNVYAGKIVSKEVLRKHQMKEKIVQEISIHKTLNNEHVVGFYGFFEDEAYIYILLELCRKRSMAELHKRRRSLTDPEVRYYMKQVLCGVQYLHENKIIHRDLKLGNIFISDNIQVKIGDFGLATQIENGERKKTMCGTPNYIAPEILEKKGHGYEVDVWSVGCIIFTLLTGKPPFETRTLKETYKRIRCCDYGIPVTMDRCAAQMIRRIFVRDPSIRPNVNALIQDKFFTKGYTPPSLPPSCLVTAPQFVFMEQTIKRKPLAQLNVCKEPTKQKKSEVTVSISEEQSMWLTAERFPLSESYNFLSTLKVQLLKVLDSKPLEKDPSLADEAEDPAAQPIMWISCWVDYSDKYGFAYKLCDNSIGVVFLDCTKLVLLANGINVQYTDQDGSEKYFTVIQYDENLRKKVRLLKLFEEYMGTLTRTGAAMPIRDSDCLTRLPVLCNWMRYNRAVVMHLSNGTLQINYFSDHSKIILCPLMGAITLIDKNEVFRTYRLNLIEQYGCNKNLSWRIHYAIRKIDELLKQAMN